MEGLVIGIVAENYDSNHPGMVCVTFPSFDKSGQTTSWIPVATRYAGKSYGVYLLPEKEEQVIVGFIGGDTHCGIVLGSLWNTKNTIPEQTVTEENQKRCIVTKGGHRIIITDGDEGEIAIQSSAGHSIKINDKNKQLTLSTADGKQTLTLKEDGSTVSLTSGDKLEIKAEAITISGKVTIKGQTVAIEADNDLSLKGKQVKLAGSTAKLGGQNTELTGSNVKVESSGILTLKGSMTKIN